MQLNLNSDSRVWWAVWLGVSFISCWFLALTTYHKWCENPVVIVYAPQLSPVSTIPFPAITICPLTKTRVEAFNLTEVFEMVKNRSVLDEYRYSGYTESFHHYGELLIIPERDSCGLWHMSVHFPVTGKISAWIQMKLLLKHCTTCPSHSPKSWICACGEISKLHAISYLRKIW